MAGQSQKLLDFSTPTHPVVHGESTPTTGNALARRSDPDTSHESASDIADKVNRLEMIFLRTLIRLGRVASAYDVAAAQTEWSNDQTIRKRAGGLKNKGLIRRADREGITPDGSACERFELTQAGLAALQSWGNER